MTLSHRIQPGDTLKGKTTKRLYRVVKTYPQIESDTVDSIVLVNSHGEELNYSRLQIDCHFTRAR